MLGRAGRRNLVSLPAARRAGPLCWLLYKPISARLHAGKEGCGLPTPPSRETRTKVKRYARAGVLAVEMEAAALMAIAAYRGAEFGCVLVITDQLFGEQWVQAFAREEVRRAKRMVAERLARLLLERVGPC